MPVIRIILVACFYLALLRATKIGLFYPTDEQALGQIDYRVQAILNYVLISGVMAYLFLSNNYRFIGKALANIWLGLLIGICVLSVGLSNDKADSFKFLLAIIAISMPLMLYWQAYGSERLIGGLARFAIIMAFLNMAYLVVFPGYAMMSGAHAGAWRGMFDHKNGAGPFFAVGFFFILDQLRRGAFRNVLPPVIAMGIALLFVVMSRSTTGVVGFLSMGLMYSSLLVMLRLSNPMERLLMMASILGLGLFLYFVAGGAIMQLFFDATGKDSTFTGRTNVWAALLELSYKRPLIGYGLGQSQQPDFMSQIHGIISFDAKTSHNSYIDLALNIGYPGVILFVIILLKQFCTLLLRPYPYARDLNTAAIGAGIIIVAMMVGFTTAGVFIGRSIFWLYLFVGLLLSATPPRQAGREGS